MRLITGLIMCAMVMAAATAPSVAGSYDGTYVGASMVLTGNINSGKGNACTTTVTAPAPLTIANGHAQTKWANGTLQGDVSPDGKLIMHAENSGRFEGQIDASGVLKGYYQGYCVFNLTWQRRG